MAKKEEIIVTISPDGNVEGDVITGPGGAGCLDNLAKLLDGLGNKRAENKKPAFYEQQQVGRAGVRRGR